MIQQETLQRYIKEEFILNKIQEMIETLMALFTIKEENMSG